MRRPTPEPGNFPSRLVSDASLNFSFNIFISQRQAERKEEKGGGGLASLEMHRLTSTPYFMQIIEFYLFSGLG